MRKEHRTSSTKRTTRFFRCVLSALCATGTNPPTPNGETHTHKKKHFFSTHGSESIHLEEFLRCAGIVLVFEEQEGVGGGERGAEGRPEGALHYQRLHFCKVVLDLVEVAHLKPTRGNLLFSLVFTMTTMITVPG